MMHYEGRTEPDASQSYGAMRGNPLMNKEDYMGKRAFCQRHDAVISTLLLAPTAVRSINTFLGEGSKSLNGLMVANLYPALD